MEKFARPDRDDATGSANIHGADDAEQVVIVMGSGAETWCARHGRIT